MRYPPTTDLFFLEKLKHWFRCQPEILALIRYSHAAGSKDFEFFSSFQAFKKAIRSLPPLTCVTVFRQPQLPLRGIVDDGFIDACLKTIPDGSEYLLVEGIKRVYGQHSWFHHDLGDSHEELREDLGQLRGVLVAAGLCPSWLEDTDDVASAVVPGELGLLRSAAY
jgi:hypothetical protein